MNETIPMQLARLDMDRTRGYKELLDFYCGQQLYDVIDITDTRAGLTSEKKRVLGLILIYNPHRGEYRQRLWLGAV